MKQKKCRFCGSKNDLTKDHIIPKAIYKLANQIVPSFKKNLGKKNLQTLCADCNTKKRASIDVSNETGLNFWLDVRSEINKKINEQFK